MVERRAGGRRFPACQREDLVWVEADGAADLVAGEFAGFPLVEDRPRRQAEELAELAGGDEPLGHDPA